MLQKSVSLLVSTGPVLYLSALYEVSDTLQGDDTRCFSYAAESLS